MNSTADVELPDVIATPQIGSNHVRTSVMRPVFHSKTAPPRQDIPIAPSMNHHQSGIVRPQIHTEDFPGEERSASPPRLTPSSSFVDDTCPEQSPALPIPTKSAWTSVSAPQQRLHPGSPQSLLRSPTGSQHTNLRDKLVSPSSITQETLRCVSIPSFASCPHHERFYMLLVVEVQVKCLPVPVISAQRPRFRHLVRE